MNNLRNCPMFRRVFVQTQIKPACWILRVRAVERKASWGLFHLAVAKPRHTGQSILGVWQRTHVGWQMTKMCGLVTVRPPPPPPARPGHLTPPRLQHWWWAGQKLGNAEDDLQSDWINNVIVTVVGPKRLRHEGFIVLFFLLVLPC